MTLCGCLRQKECSKSRRINSENYIFAALLRGHIPQTPKVPKILSVLNLDNSFKNSYINPCSVLNAVKILDLFHQLDELNFEQEPHTKPESNILNFRETFSKDFVQIRIGPLQKMAFIFQQAKCFLSYLSKYCFHHQIETLLLPD